MMIEARERRIPKRLRDWFLDGIEWPVAVLLVLILLRPLADVTWDWKHTLGISPLQLIGVGLPFFLLWAVWRKTGDFSSFWRCHQVVTSGCVCHRVVTSWLFLGFAAGVAALAVDPSKEAAGMALKFVLPGLLILFGFHYLRSELVLTRIAQAVLIAAIVPTGFILYELIFGPIGTSIRSGVIRYTGPYAQVSVYGIHFSMALMGAGYLALRRESAGWFYALLTLTALLAFSSAWVVHLTTWAVYMAVLSLLILFLILRRAWLKSGTLVAVAVLLTAAGFSIRSGEEYVPIVTPDIAVLEGEAPLAHFGNSRGLIWGNILSDFADLPLHAKLLGSSFSGRNYFGAAGFGAHNDFLRILMMSGIVGLLLYLTWLGLTIRAVLRLKGELRFLGLAAVVILLGFSVGLTATYIVPLGIVVMGILGGLHR